MSDQSKQHEQPTQAPQELRQRTLERKCQNSEHDLERSRKVVSPLPKMSKE